MTARARVLVALLLLIGPAVVAQMRPGGQMRIILVVDSSSTIMPMITDFRAGLAAFLETLPGAQLIVRVEAERIFDNCPRYLHRMELQEYSHYAPRAEHEPPIPSWKRRPEYRDALAERDLAALAQEENAG